MTPAALLAELAARGVTLEARGGRLRFRPRAAIGPELVRRVRAHKAALLRMLDPPAPAAHPAGEAWPAPAAHPAGEAWPPPGHAWPDPEKLAGLPRVVAELAWARPGWSAKAWRARLAQLAERCESVAPGRAAELRRAAAVIGALEASNTVHYLAQAHEKEVPRGEHRA